MIFLWKLEFAWGTLLIKDFIQNVKMGIMTADQFKQVTGQDYQTTVNPPSEKPVDTTPTDSSNQTQPAPTA